jgi:hypothetical protein
MSVRRRDVPPTKGHLLDLCALHFKTPNTLVLDTASLRQSRSNQARSLRLSEFAVCSDPQQTSGWMGLGSTHVEDPAFHIALRYENQQALVFVETIWTTAGDMNPTAASTPSQRYVAFGALRANSAISPAMRMAMASTRTTTVMASISTLNDATPTLDTNCLMILREAAIAWPFPSAFSPLLL